MSLPTTDWVALDTKFTPGWPWPEDSWGLDPRYGVDGWCRGCGTPTREQMGPLTIQGSGFPSSEVWMPHWTYDAVCVSAALASRIASQFDVRMMDVWKPRTGPTGFKQLIPVVTDEPWYDPEELERAVIAEHSKWNGSQTGSRCQECDRYKWFGIEDCAVSVSGSALRSASGDLLASPESFGDGMSSFRNLLFTRALARLIVKAHPRHWSIIEVRISST